LIVCFSLIRLFACAVDFVSFGWVGASSQNGPGHQTEPYRKATVVTDALHSLGRMWRAHAPLASEALRLCGSEALPSALHGGHILSGRRAT